MHNVRFFPLLAPHTVAHHCPVPRYLFNYSRPRINRLTRRPPHPQNLFVNLIRGERTEEREFAMRRTVQDSPSVPFDYISTISTLWLANVHWTVNIRSMTTDRPTVVRRLQMVAIQWRREVENPNKGFSIDQSALNGQPLCPLLAPRATERIIDFSFLSSVSLSFRCVGGELIFCYWTWEGGQETGNDYCLSSS